MPFTPMNETRTERLHFDLEDVQLISGSLYGRQKGRKAIVEIHGQRYAVYGAACGIPHCMCDAVLKPI